MNASRKYRNGNPRQMLDADSRKKEEARRPAAAGGDPRSARRTTVRPALSKMIFRQHIRLNRRLGRRLHSYVIHRLDGRPYRPPNWLAMACTGLEQYLRLRQKAAREEPHIFGPHADLYYRDTLHMEQQRIETEAALEKIYGPDPDGQCSNPNQIWDKRYVEAPSNRKFFLKWFKREYGA
jgi:hypothetical protein